MKNKNGVISFWHNTANLAGCIIWLVISVSSLKLGVGLVAGGNTYSSLWSDILVILIPILLTITTIPVTLLGNYKIEIHSDRIVMRRITGKIRTEVKIREIVEVSEILRNRSLTDQVFLIIRDDRPVNKCIYNFFRNTYIRFRPNAKRMELIKQLWPYEITQYCERKELRFLEQDREAYFAMLVERNRRMKIKK